MDKIRNFSIIAHVDHGKSTLADRMLEITETIPKREMKEQALDTLDLERERGITIKMQPASMKYKYNNEEYILNLIDTPGHIDFSYEVSRSLKAVEGVVLLVDATQGVQSQTLFVLEQAKENNLTIIPVLTKIDVEHADTNNLKKQLAKLVGTNESNVLSCSGKTGEGVKELLDEVVIKIPSPKNDTQNKTRALVFDFSYTSHSGVISFVRVVKGRLKKNDNVEFIQANQDFVIKDVGICKPQMKSTEFLDEGMIGYVVTGIKETSLAVIGDTLAIKGNRAEVFEGYEFVNPVIWASVYPKDSNDYNLLFSTLKKMKLYDFAFTYEEEQSNILGKGFRCGFLGMLHLEIILERIQREGGIELMTTTPTIDYKVKTKREGELIIKNPYFFPSKGDILEIIEPWVRVDILLPNSYIPAVSQLYSDFEGYILSVEDFSEFNVLLIAEMPFRELMRNFFDKLKSVSSGYASLSYKKIENRPAEITRMDVLLAEEIVPAFTTIISKRQIEKEAKSIVNVLYETIPRALFEIKIQAMADGRIVSSKTLKALRKNVTEKLYGGDITRKKKLLEKQKKGKKKRSVSAKVNIPHDVFIKVLQRKNN